MSNNKNLVIKEITNSTEMGDLKTKLKATWSAGDFGQIGRSYLSEASEYVEKLNLKRGEKVLDVACGTGISAIPAARCGAIVIGVDIAPNLLEQARKWAEKENLNCRFEEGDVEDLKFADGNFDTVLTMFGAMFAPRPEQVAAELVRVCRSGGRVVMTNWTPDGFIGQMFRISASHVPTLPMPAPILWGIEDIVEERFGDSIADLKFTRRKIPFSFPFSPAEVVEHYRQYFGPMQNAFLALEKDRGKQTTFRRDLENHWKKYNMATDGTTRIESEFLEVIAVCK